MNYHEALAFVSSFDNYEKKLPKDYSPRRFRLKRIHLLLRRLGNPELRLIIAHVTGTNGKGSTVAFLASIAKAHGYRAGMYTSPHLIDVRERIRINDDIISRREFAEEMGEIKKALKHWPSSAGQLTYFEILTALALSYFRKNKTDLVILEVGLGGRLDATNAVRTSLSIFTEIGLDHQKWLGSTVSKIAREKAGIIKKGIPVLTGVQKPEVLRVLRRRSTELAVPLIFSPGRKLVRMSETGLSFKMGVNGQKILLKIRLLGLFQMNNAALAVRAFELLSRFYGYRLSEAAIKEGLSKTRWPGRIEIVKRNPTVVLDGGHNNDAAKALTTSMRKLFPRRDLRIIYGASKDKAVGEVMKELRKLRAPIYLASARHPRAANVSDLEFAAKPYFKEIHVSRRLPKAIVDAKKSLNKKGVILVTGSLFLVGEARKILCRN